MPFCNLLERDIHFAKHGKKFSAVDAAEYERMADDFAFGEMRPSVRECVRPSGSDQIRFDFGTHYFSVCRIVPEPPCVRTFYPVRQTIIANRGGEEQYFVTECSRIDL